MKSHEGLQGVILTMPVVLEGVKVLQTAVEGQRVDWSQAATELAAMEGFGYFGCADCRSCI